MSELDRIIRLRIALLDVEPSIWRIVEVPITTTLRALHEVIQAAMPWQSYHLYEFQIGEQRYGVPDPEFGADLPIRDAKSIRLSRFLSEGVQAFIYVYDFGDNWQHAVTVEAVVDSEPGVSYPRLHDSAGRAPPEDVGGTFGFEEFLKAVTRPRAREHKRMVEWYGGPFDPAEVDVPAITTRIDDLARRRTQGKAAGARSRAKMR